MTAGIDTKLEIPRLDLFPLLDAAERRDMTLAEFLLHSARAVAHLDTNPESVEALHSLGFTDAEMARALSMTNSAVSERRRRLHLPPNQKVRHDPIGIPA